MTRIAIVGGGFTGAAAAIHLARAAQHPLDIQVIEPRDEPGRGVAFSAQDPDHRLNSLAYLHVVIPETPHDFQDWLERSGRLDRDPEMRGQDGSLFARRADFGTYMNELFNAHTARNPSHSRIRHIKRRACDLKENHEGFSVSLDDGQAIAVDVVIIATNNEQPRLPASFDETVARHPAFIANPWDLKRLDGTGAAPNILLLGAGLTAADIAATIMRDKPAASIDAFSRTGIRPTSRLPSKGGPRLAIWDRLNEAPSLFEQRHGPLRTVREILIALRADIADKARQGLAWQTAFDDVRESARALWMQLPQAEKRRFQRHLRRRYDSCRFRYAPQTEALLRQGEQSRQLTFRRARIDHAEPRGAAIHVAWHDPDTGRPYARQYDAVINCTGPSTRPDSSNPFLHAIIKRGLARVAPLGIGLDVDAQCHVIAGDGGVQPNLFALGALSFATFGYALAVPFIAHQIVEALPALLQASDRPGSETLAGAEFGEDVTPRGD